MITKVHMCIDISGVLRWPNAKLQKLFYDKDGTPRSGAYVRDYLRLELAKGRRVLPMGTECDNFDYQTGCKGHPQEETTTEPEGSK